MAEPLREVPEELPGGRIDLLRQQADVVRGIDGLLEDVGPVVDSTCSRERRREPERAGEERALLVAPAARAIEQAVAAVEPLKDDVDRPREALGRELQPAETGAAQDGGVERVRTGELRFLR